VKLFVENYQLSVKELNRTEEPPKSIEPASFSCDLSVQLGVYVRNATDVNGSKEGSKEALKKWIANYSC
jgi:hypothetical protein